MLDNEKDIHENLKDSNNSVAMSVKDKDVNTAYSKANKLITALFMVTDIIDKDEPIRAKLRTLGMEVISDIYVSPDHTPTKINQIISFLGIASTIGMISEMNSNILRKEFKALINLIDEFNVNTNPEWLEKFMLPKTNKNSDMEITKMEMATPYQGHQARIGVQKGSTLLEALQTVKMSDKSSTTSAHHKDDFDLLKKQRREEIIKVIKEDKQILMNGGATISDIRKGVKLYSAKLGIIALLSCSEKTLQRELVSMVKDNVLKKTGEKRWSKYFV